MNKKKIYKKKNENIFKQSLDKKALDKQKDFSFDENVKLTYKNIKKKCGKTYGDERIGVDLIKLENSMFAVKRED